MQFRTFRWLLRFGYLCGSVSSISVQCRDTALLAPEDNCVTVLDTINWQSRQPGGNFPKAWGRTVGTTQGSVMLPAGIYLRHTNPRQEPNHCEIYLDNVPAKLNEVDDFSNQDLVIAGRSILSRCYPAGKTGRALPTSRGAVYVTTRYCNPYSVQSRDNFTSIDLDPLEEGYAVA